MATSSQQPSYYRVFQPSLDTAAHDELDPEKRYHTGIFVQHDDEGSGTLFHVTGDIMSARGMAYAEKGPGYKIRLSNYYVKSKEVYLGRMEVSRYEAEFKPLMRSLPRPVRQQGINFWSTTREITWVRPDGELYEPEEERTPLMKCNEWTERVALPAIHAAGLLV